MKLKSALTAPFERCYKQFRLGAMLFFTGMVTIYSASEAMTPSLAQEWVTLAGLVLVGVGFVIAILAQGRILISRLYHFWTKR